VPAKAYSYLRFSTPEQMVGDSFRRQTQLASDYAARHGLELDTELTLRDLGVSAFRGRNARTGALGAFLKAIDDGMVPEGSLLLVENLDRVTRQDPWDAMPTFQSIINAGVTIVTLQDGKSYSREELRANPMRIMESLFVMIRANEESATKARRVRAAWSTKRQNAATKPLTSQCPGWLRLRDDRSGFDIIPDRAAVVRRVYEMTAGGIGQHAIAGAFNAEGISPFGRGKYWQRCYVVTLLKNPAVIGTYVPHEMEHDATGKCVRKPLAAVAGYFPAVVDTELYERVQALRMDTVNPQRGRHAGAPVSNVLGGIATCPLCSGRMTRVTKGPRGGRYLVCAAAKAGAGCQYHAVHYDDVERCLVERREEIVGTCPGGAGGEIDDQLQDIEGQIWGTEEGLERLLDAIQAGRTSALVHRVREVESELEQLRQREAELHHRRAATQGPMLERRLEQLSEALTDLGEDRTAANVLLRGLLSSAVVDWRDGALTLNWNHGGESRLQYGWPAEP
jgi:DNA invertase Pin-like site-specific DNA recombinase